MAEGLFLSSPLAMPTTFHVATGLTLSQIVSSLPGLDVDRFRLEGLIESDGFEVPREWWDEWTPSEGEFLKFYLVHAGGGEDGGKNILSAIASVLVSFAVFSVSGGALSGLLGAKFAADTLGARLASVAVGVAGQLALNALFPPTSPRASDKVRQATDASIQGNVLGKGAALPRVFGTFTLQPPLLTQPRAYLQGEDTIVEGVFALAGPTDFEDIRANGVAIGDLEGVEVFIDNGLPEERRVNYFDRYAHTRSMGVTLSRHQVATGETETSDNQLADQDNPDRSLPQWHRFSSRAGSHYVQATLTFSGLYDPTESDGELSNHIVWLRLRSRKRGDMDWLRLATLPYRSKTNNILKKEIRIFFGDNLLIPSPRFQRYNGFVLPGVPGAVSVDHVRVAPADGVIFPQDVGLKFNLRDEGIDLYLDDPYFSDTGSEYEFELMRSEMIREGDLDDAALMVYGDGSTLDFFDAREVSGAWTTKTDVGKFSDAITLDLVSSVVKGDGIGELAPVATLHVRAKNVDISELSVRARGLVPLHPDYSSYGPSSNPADNYRFLMTGPLSVDVVSPSELNVEALEAWRDECVSKGLEVNGSYSGSIGEALDLVCAAGHARYSEGFSYSVIFDRDTSTEPAMQHFTPINTSGLSWSKAYTKRASKFRIKFNNRLANHELDEIEVANPYPLGNQAENIESLEYPLIDTPDQVVSRALLDFKQLDRAVRYSFKMGLESLAVEQGVVGLLSSDFLHRAIGWTRITGVLSGTDLQLEDDLSVSLPADFLGVANVFELADLPSYGVTHSASIRTFEDTHISEITNYSSDNRVITIDSTAGISVGDLCTVGPAGQSTIRVIVTDIIPDGQSEATVICMEE